jgi:hypothetical protein
MATASMGQRFTINACQGDAAGGTVNVGIALHGRLTGRMEFATPPLFSPIPAGAVTGRASDILRVRVYDETKAKVVANWVVHEAELASKLPVINDPSTWGVFPSSLSVDRQTHFQRTVTLYRERVYRVSVELIATAGAAAVTGKTTADFGGPDSPAQSRGFVLEKLVLNVEGR